MPDVNELAHEILRDGYLMSLGTHDAEGVWVADVIFIPQDDFHLYWISMPDTRHSKAIETNPAVACAITAEQTKGKERALQISGHAQRLDGPRFELEKLHRRKRGMQDPTRPGEMIEDGHVWYELVPDRIELIHSEKFDFNRQRVL